MLIFKKIVSIILILLLLWHDAALCAEYLVPASARDSGLTDITGDLKSGRKYTRWQRPSAKADDPAYARLQELIAILIKNKFLDKPFTLRQYRDLWKNRHPGKQPLAESTAGKDINLAKEKGLLVDAGKNNRRKQYRLTQDALWNFVIHDPRFIAIFDNAREKNKKRPRKQAITSFLNNFSINAEFVLRKSFDETFLMCIKEGSTYSKTVRIIRYAPHSHVDYLCGKRSDPQIQHLAHVMENGYKFEILRDAPDVLQNYAEALDRYAGSEFSDIINKILNPHDPQKPENTRNAINALKDLIENSEDKNIQTYAYKLLHSLLYTEDKRERIFANKILHDLYTGRPPEFPPTETFRTILHGEDQKIEIPCVKDETKARIQLCINGERAESPIPMVKIGDKFTATISAQKINKSTFHYAVQVKSTKGKWRYKNTPEASGVIKSQKDVRGKNMLEVRTAIFDLPKDTQGKIQYNKDGSLVISTFEQLKNKLPDLKKEYDAIWLMDAFEWGPVVPPGKDPSSFAPLDHITIAESLGGEAGLLELKAEAKKHGIELILNLIPHISRANKSLPAYFPAYTYFNNELVPLAAGDGVSFWDDSNNPKWRMKEALDFYIAVVTKFAFFGFSYRADVGQAYDATSPVDPSMRGLAKIFGDVVVARKKPNGRFETTDLQGTTEPNVILSALAYEIKKVNPDAVIYAENFPTLGDDNNWHNNAERLIKSDTIPYGSLHEELIQVLRKKNKHDVQTIIDHVAYMTELHRRIGGQHVTVYASHDYQRDPQEPNAIYSDKPPLELYRDAIIPFMTTIIMLNYNGPIMWHFARLLGSEKDSFDDRINLSLAEFWKIWVNNIREFDYEGAVKDSLAYLEKNPRLKHLGTYADILKGILRSYVIMQDDNINIMRHTDDCISVMRGNDQKRILGFINYGFQRHAVVRNIPDLPKLKKDQIYKVTELFRYSKEHGYEHGRTFYLPTDAMADEIRHLGFYELLNDWETVIYSIEPIPIQEAPGYKDIVHDMAIQEPEKYYAKIRRNIIQRSHHSLYRHPLMNYKNFGREERVKHSIITKHLLSALKRKREQEFIDIVIKLLEITDITQAIPIGTISTILFDIIQVYRNTNPMLYLQIKEYLTNAILAENSIVKRSLRYDMVCLLRGMTIGEVAMVALEARGIASTGGIAPFITDLGKSLVQLGIDASIFTFLFKLTKKGYKIVSAPGLTYTGKNVVVPIFGQSPEEWHAKNTGHILFTMLAGIVPAYAIENELYTKVLYGGDSAEQLAMMYRWYALAALEAIRTMNKYVSHLITNEGSTGFAIPYLTMEEYEYLSKDPHFRHLLTTLHINHNLHESYLNTIKAGFPPHYDFLMQLAGFDPRKHRYMLSPWNDSLVMNPAYAANRAASHSATVSLEYRDASLHSTPLLGDPEHGYPPQNILMQKYLEGNYSGYSGRIGTVNWQERNLRDQSFFEFEEEQPRKDTSLAEQVQKLLQRIGPLMKEIKEQKESPAVLSDEIVGLQKKLQDVITEPLKNLNKPLLSLKEERMKLYERTKHLKANAKTSLQEEAGVEKDPHATLITMVHRLSEQKGFEIAIPAIEDVLKKDKSVQIVIAGPPEESEKGGEFERQLNQMNENPAYQGRFKYIGPVSANSKMYEYLYLGADIFLMPSKWEPKGLSQDEAMALGTIVVATDIVSSVVDDNDPDGRPANGYRHDFSIEGLTHAISRAIEERHSRDIIPEGQSMSRWDQRQYNCETFDSRWISSSKLYINDTFSPSTSGNTYVTADVPEILLIFSEGDSEINELRELLKQKRGLTIRDVLDKSFIKEVEETIASLTESGGTGSPDIKNSIKNIESKLIRHGFNTDRGLDFVMHDALIELSRHSNDPRPLIRKLAIKYFELYYPFYEKEIPANRLVPRADKKSQPKNPRPLRKAA